MLTRSAPEKQWQEFGGYVRALREAHQWSLRHVAREIPMAPGYLSNIEQGLMAPPSSEVITRLTDLLGVSASHLLARAGRLKPETWRALLSHPAIPAILSTIPGMTLEDAQRFCAVATAPDEHESGADSAA